MADTPAMAPRCRMNARTALCWLLIVAGLAGVWGWYRLGQGRLLAFQYPCTLLAVASALIALLGMAGVLLARAPHRTVQRWTGHLAALAGGFLVCVALYLLAQAVCWWVLQRQADRIARTGSHTTGATYQSDPVLGYMPKANTAGDAQFMVDGQVIFDYTYRTDAFHRRRVPAQAGQTTPRTRALLFFGCSYTFGEGVNDGETLPNQFALRAPDTAVYNYAFSGYGPHHMLARLESMDIRGEVPEPEAAAVYLFIPNHVRRVIGSMSVISWTESTPWYVIGEDGLPERRGSFREQRATLNAWYGFMRGDFFLKVSGIDLPPRLTAAHYGLTAAVIARAAERFRAQFGSDAFYVILYPNLGPPYADAREMLPYLQSHGLRVLDYTRLLPGPADRYFFPAGDKHPRAETHALIAERLAADLAVLIPEIDAN